jgi:hypothetical protein
VNQVLERDHGGRRLSAHNLPPVVALGDVLVPMRSLLPSAASAAAAPPRAAQGTPTPTNEAAPRLPLGEGRQHGAPR